MSGQSRESNFITSQSAAMVQTVPSLEELSAGTGQSVSALIDDLFIFCSARKKVLLVASNQNENGNTCLDIILITRAGDHRAVVPS